MSDPYRDRRPRSNLPPVKVRCSRCKVEVDRDAVRRSGSEKLCPRCASRPCCTDNGAG